MSRFTEGVSRVARLPYVEPTQAAGGTDLTELYAHITGLRGSVLNLYRALASQPSALEAFMGMSRYVRDESQLDPQLRELAILATGYALDVEYEKHHHVPAARRSGVSEEKIGAFPNWRRSEVYSDIERIVLEYADQVARRRDVDDETFAALKLHLSDAEIVDLAVTVGWYHLCAAILGPLRVEIENA
jgi:alkylhydroperoxidase family enzyme